MPNCHPMQPNDRTLAAMIDKLDSKNVEARIAAENELKALEMLRKS
jgi:hypothetical protein